MIEFGKTLREAREAKGYTIAQLADITHIMHQMVEDLENENFSRIAAPIYGRGFVKLYCEAVGLDPKPMIAEYMAILNGDRLAAIHVRKPAAAEPAACEEAQQSAPTPQPPQEKVETVTLFEAPAEEAAPEEEAPQAAPPAKRLAPLRPPAPLPDHPGIKGMPESDGRIWRIALVAGVAAVLLWAIAAGARALYRATMTVPEEDNSEVAAAETAKPQEPAAQQAAPAEAKPGGPRKPISVPPLYID